MFHYQFGYSDRTLPLSTFVSAIGSYETLKKQFDWLVDGEVAHLIHKNLRPELTKLEMFLRYR
jgi:hypothetical protein